MNQTTRAMPINQTPSWQALIAHQRAMGEAHLRDLFAADPRRFETFSIGLDGLLLDYSKNRITAQTMALLCALAREAGVEDRRARMFAGDVINETEGRAVLHVALRAPPERRFRVDGRDIMPDVSGVLSRIEQFCGEVHDSTWRGHSGEAIRAVVNIGIGGSDLGPAMVTQALTPYWKAGILVHFVSNVDAAHLAETLAGLDPATTLFVIASKTFTTQETLTNAYAARRWIVSHLGEEAVARHFVAVSTNAPAVAAFGIAKDSMFPFWDWVGGRYSLWSAIGLPIALAVGYPRFAALLAGAHAMDEHFKAAPLERNLPVIMALLGVWAIDFFGWTTQAILPYAQNLTRFPAFLQQLDMESNGKRITRAGAPVSWATGPVVFGESGTNGQHAFYQLLHQGTQVVPADFIAVAASAYPAIENARILLSHCLAQTEALMKGRTREEAEDAMRDAGADAEAAKRLAPHRSFPGNRVSNTLVLDRLDPFHLGLLIALYEHKVFVQGIIWNINSFDQWGVELGKELAKPLLRAFEQPGPPGPGRHDSSTAGLLAYLKARITKGAAG